MLELPDMELDDIQPVNNKPQQSAEQHMAKPETPFENICTPHFPKKLLAGLFLLWLRIELPEP